MQRSYKSLLSFFALMLITLAGYSQADTMLVPVMVDGSPFGAINKTIMGDTLADGSRANPDRTYKLQRGAIYFLNGVMAANFDLRLIADAPDDMNKPPILTTGIDMMGAAAAPDLYIQCFGDATFKNIVIQNTPPNLSVEIAFSIQLLKENGKYMFDGCYWQGSRWLSIGSWAINPSVTIQNCYFRNVQSTTDVFNGRGISFQNRPVDTIRMVNNTFFNMNSFAFQGHGTTVKYFHFEHNSIVNSVKWPFQFQWVTDANISNNIFYNCHSYGEYPGERQDADGMPFGVINLTNLPQEYIDSVELNLSEETRKLTFNNNAWFYSSEVMNYFATSDTLEGGSFMNSRTKNYFDDDTNYPLMTSSNTMNMDPGFINDGDVEDDLVTWMTSFRNGIEVMYWGYDPDNDRFGVQWPIPEDLAYSNTTMQTATGGGFPVGDLNWWNKVGEWEDHISSVSYVEVPQDFQLKQNKPNPFSEKTTIEFSVTESTNINLSIYDLSGKLIKVLADGVHSVGEYTQAWDGVDGLGTATAPGVYLYVLRSDSSIATGKMTFLGK